MSVATCEVSTGHGGEVVVRVGGEIDATSAPLLEHGLDEAIDSYSSDVVIDLAGVSFMDSTGLGVLVRARLRLDDARRSTRIAHPSHPVVRLLGIAGLSEWIVGHSDDAT